MKNKKRLDSCIKMLCCISLAKCRSYIASFLYYVFFLKKKRPKIPSATKYKQNQGSESLALLVKQDFTHHYSITYIIYILTYI